MFRTRVKICGITRPEDAALAAEFGADAIGLNFFAGPRRVNLDIARQILVQIPPLVTPVGLTSGPSPQYPNAPTFAEIQAGALSGDRGRLNITTFQFYGTEILLAREDMVPLTLWTVCHVRPGDIASQVASHLSSLSFSCSTVLLDSASDTQLGGTGRCLDWRAVGDASNLLLQKEAVHQIVLAGGLTPDNVAEAIRIALPYAVDVSSGVEVPGKPGIKDPIKMRDFIQAAQSA